MKTVICLLGLFAATAAAHELEENRATLILRDRSHLSVTFYLSYPEVLWRTLAPERPFAAFLFTWSGMSASDLEKELRRAQARFESSTHMIVGGREVALSRWTWPDIANVQTLLQRRIAQMIADPGAHTHEAPVEVHADLVAPQEIVAVRAQLPEEWQTVLVVWFRPGQQWVEGKAVSAEMRFPPGL